MSVIACAAWVRRGAAREHPDKVELTPDELKALIEETTSDLKDLEAGSDEEGEENEIEHAEEAAAKATSGKSKSKPAKSSKDDEDDLAKYNLDNYDEEDNDVVVGGLAKLAVFSSNAEDPYITHASDDDDEVEDFTVQATDNLVVVGRTEDALSHIEIHVYNEQEEDFFQHHDILLSSFPLCIEWLDYDQGSETPGNLLAVGSMSPQIEIWDLDVIDSVEPAQVLGEKLKKKSKKKKSGAVAGHTKEIMGLSWNALQRNVLASSSADCTVRIWDLATGTSLRTLDHHHDKVQVVRWNPSSAPVLLSGSFDGTVAVLDSRSPQAVSRFSLGSSIECCIWDVHNPSRFFASCENGLVYCGDSREPGKIAFSISAHNTPVSALAISQHAPGCLVTGASDQTVRVWDVQTPQPTFVSAHPVENMTAVYALSFSPELPFTVVAAGHRGGIRVLDLAQASAVQKRFAERLTGPPPAVHKDLSSLNGPERENVDDMMADEDAEWEDDDEDAAADIEDAGELEEEEEEAGEVAEEMAQMDLDKGDGAASKKDKKKKKKKKSKQKKPE